MKLNWKDFARKCQFPILLAAGGLPLPAAICANAAPEAAGKLVLLAAGYILLAWLAMALPGRIRIPAGAAMAAGILAAGFFMLPLMEHYGLWIGPIMLAVALLGGLRMGGWQRDREIHPIAPGIGLGIHVIVQVLVIGDKNVTGGAVYGPVQWILTGSFLIYGAMTMLMMNRASLIGAVNGVARGNPSVPVSMRRKNRLMTIGLMIITLLVAAIPAVIRAIEKVWSWLMLLLWNLIELILKLFPMTESAGGDNAGMGDLSGLGGEQAETSLFSKILMGLLLALAAVAATALVILALRVVWRKLKALVKYLIERLNAYMVVSSEDYVDEIADTRESGQAERTLTRFRKRLQRKRIDESTLSPKERIRYRYRLIWDKHPEWTQDRTARENLAEQAASLYERARYSDHEITGADAEAFARNAEK